MLKGVFLPLHKTSNMIIVLFLLLCLIFNYKNNLIILYIKIIIISIPLFTNSYKLSFEIL